MVTSFDYDPRNLVLRRSYSDDTPDEELRAIDAVGRPLTAANSVGGVSTAFDALGRIVSRADAAGRTLGYSYDAGGNRTRMTLGGTTVDYEYDAADRQTRQISSFGAVQMTYDADGHMTQLTRPNGSRTVATFDVADQLTGLTTAAGAKTLATLDYTYDDVGNIKSRVQAVGQTSTTTYTYDPLRRLTRSAGGPLPSTYTYDAAGNRLTWAAPDDPQTPKPRDPFVQTNAFDAASQLITSREVRENGGATFVDVTTNQYDRNGNRLRTDTVAQAPGQSSGTGYDYDAENRLIAQAPIGDRPGRGNGNEQRNNTRSYDALGRLVTETTGTVTKTWTSDGLRPVLAGSSAGASFYMRDSAGELLAERTPTAGPGWFVTDALGSIMGVTDSKAALKRPTTYSDYGFNLQTSGSAFGFGGELADSLLPPGNGIGNDTPVLNHYYARSYDPILGTWLQRDPLGTAPAVPETMGEYQFVGGNPSSRTDMLGYLSVAPPGAQPKLTVVNSNGAWNGGALQGSSAATQTLQPTYSPQVTVDSRYLQNTVDPFTLRRNQAAYGQLAAMGSPGSPFSGWSTSGSSFDIWDLLGAANDARGAAARAAAQNAALQSQKLREGSSSGGKQLPGAARAKQVLLVVGRWAGPAGPIIDAGSEFDRGHEPRRVVEHVASSTAGGATGAAIGGAICFGPSIPTFGLLSVVCAAAGSAVGGWAGGEIYDRSQDEQPCKQYKAVVGFVPLGALDVDECHPA